MLAWSFAMIGRRPATLYVPALAIFFALLLVSARPAQAQTETVLYTFGSQSGDGAYPAAVRASTRFSAGAPLRP